MPKPPKKPPVDNLGYVSPNRARLGRLKDINAQRTFPLHETFAPENRTFFDDDLRQRDDRIHSDLYNALRIQQALEKQVMDDAVASGQYPRDRVGYVSPNRLNIIHKADVGDRGAISLREAIRKQRGVTERSR